MMKTCAARRTRESGTILVMALILAFVVATLVGAMTATVHTNYRAASESLHRELAYRAAESGVSYYLALFSTDDDYLRDNPAPHEALAVGRGQFSLVSSEVSPGGTYWQVLIRGVYNGSSVDLGAVVGYRQVEIPAGVVVSGSSNPDDVVLELKGRSSVLSYDSSEGPFDPSASTGDTTVLVNGGLNLTGGSTVDADVRATGIVETGGQAVVAGETWEETREVSVEDIDDLVRRLYVDARNNDDNQILSGVFGDQWRPIRDGSVRGDLIVNGGDYVLPAGNYIFRNLRLENGSSLTFDTSLGDVTVAVVGRTSGIEVSNGSRLRIDSGGTENGLTTLLGPTTTMDLRSTSIFGQAVGQEDASRFSTMLSVGIDGLYPEIRLHSGSSAYGRIHAVNHSLNLAGNSSWYGSAVIGALHVTGSQAGPAMFAVDTNADTTILLDREASRILSRWQPSTIGL